MSAETFTFEHAGKKYTIPAFSQLPAGAFRKARKGVDDFDKAFILIEVTLGEDSKELAALDSMTPVELNEFIIEWSKGASLGESSGS
jgi:hypothetical protein